MPDQLPDTEAAAGRRRRTARTVLVVFGGAAAAALLTLPPRAWFTTNDVSTDHAPGYPDLHDRVYAASLAQALAAAESVCRALPRWTVTKTDSANKEIVAQVRTALGGFTDDVTVTVTPAGPAGTHARVTIRSRSRVGRVDLGENARHIRALQKAMDARLPRAWAPAAR